MRSCVVAVFILIGGLCTKAQADPLPEPIVRLLTDAANSGDPAKPAQAAMLAKSAYPESAGEIDALVVDLLAQDQAARIARLNAQAFLEGWSGEGEIGASQITGTISNTTIAAGVKLNRDGIYWLNHLTGLVDYQRSDGRTTANQELASYEADYVISPVVQLAGFVQWEQNPFAGFNRRFTEAPGIGYTVIGTPAVTWQVSGGPAWRQTLLIDGLSQSEVAGKAATDFTWRITPGTVLTEDAGLYYGGMDNTYYSTIALTTSVFGNLSARLSFNVNIESNPPPGIDKASTISRVTLVYKF